MGGSRRKLGRNGGRVGRANATSRAARLRLAQLAIAFSVLVAGTAATWYYFRQSAPPTVLTVGAGPYLSDSYELMREVADVVARQTDRIVIEVVATKDSSRNITLLNEKQVDLATIRADTPVMSSVRLVANLFPDFFQILTRADRGIYSVPDLAGKNVAVPPFGSDEFRSFWVVGDHYDLPITGIRWQAAAFENAAGDLLDGRIDAIFTVRSLRDRHLLDLFDDAKLKNIALRYLEIDQADAIAVKRPFLGTGRIPKGTFAGDTPTPVRDMVSSVVERVLVSRGDVDPDAIAELTRILFEHRLDLTIRFALASAIRKPDTGKGLSVPLHEGAERFYNRDEPSFIQANAEPIALMVTLAAMLGSGLLALRSRLVVRQKNRMDSYNFVLLDIAERANAASRPGELRELKAEMFGLLENVVRALDTDEVTEEGFQSFSLLWESVREILNERRAELTPRD